MSLRLLCLLMMGLHLAIADFVTLANTTPQPSQTSKTAPLKTRIRSLHVTTNIKYRYATTLVSTRVTNPNDMPREAVFAITLPETAFISGFLMELKDEVFKAYVKEKEKAKAVYDQAVQAGQFAGHVALDARDSNTFTVSVNLEAHGKVTFNLTYEELLSRKLGVYSNIINIDPKQIVEDMSIKVNIEEPTEITKLEVPEIQELNNVIGENIKENKLAKIETLSPNHKAVTWTPTPEEQKKQKDTGISGQFVVKYDVNRANNPQQILVNEGYFVHFFAPEDLPKFKKHVVFVLDYSGSMGGHKLDQLKDAMVKILSDLDPSDYFSIVLFHTLVLAWSPKHVFSDQDQIPSWQREEVPPSNVTLDQEFVVDASPKNIDSVLSYLKQYDQLGATNIMGGLRLGLELVEIGQKKFSDDHAQPLVIFLTDGQPNVEVYNTDEIIAKTKPLNTNGAPIFSLAFGYGADFNFLRKLSLSNKGFARNIYEAADSSAQLNNFYRTVASPLFSNVTFNYLPGQVDNTSSTKKKFPIFFGGSELVVAGKIDSSALEDNSSIGELSGLSSKGVHKYPIIIKHMPKTNHSTGFLEKTWAYLTIQQLLDKSGSLDNSAKNKTTAKALELALQYSFVTPLTSLVVVKPNETESAVDPEVSKPDIPEAIPLGGFGGSGGYLSAQKFALPAAPAANAYMPNQYNLYRPSQSGASTPISSYSQNPQFLAENYAPDDTYFQMKQVLLSAPDHTDRTYFEQATDVITTGSPMSNKIKLDEITWLQPLFADQNATVTVEGQDYKLGLNQTDTSFGDCTVESVDGECHHIQYCPLNAFKDDISRYKLYYHCSIPGNFLGVCCPKSLA